jgi:hypothetical protein
MANGAHAGYQEEWASGLRSIKEIAPVSSAGVPRFQDVGFPDLASVPTSSADLSFFRLHQSKPDAAIALIRQVELPNQYLDADLDLDNRSV